MDQIKVGAFLADLRRERGLTQEQLGERLGVTNKTVSRWETGSYMPPIEALEALSKEYGVTINEMIAGERLTTEQDFRVKAEENLVSAWEDSAFTLKERQEYFKGRWLKNHVLVRYLPSLVSIFLIVYGYRIGNYWLAAFGWMFHYIGIAVTNNAMMAYVERKTFEKPNSEQNSKKE